MSLKKTKTKMSMVLTVVMVISVIFPAAISVANEYSDNSNRQYNLNGNHSNDFGFRKATASDAEIIDEDIVDEDVIDGEILEESEEVPEDDSILATSSNARKDFGISGTTLTAYYGQDSVVTVPDGVKTIADEAFMGNSTIEELYLPDSVESAGIQAFAEMSALRTIDLGDGFEADFVDIFLDSLNIEEYIVSRSSSDFYSDDGVLYVDNGDVLMVFYPSSKMSDEYIIPDGADFVFLNGNYHLKSLYISRSVSRIDFNNMGSDDVAETMQLEHISVDERCKYYYISDDGILMDKQSDTIVFYPASFMTSLEQ